MPIICKIIFISNQEIIFIQSENFDKSIQALMEEM